MVLGGIEVFDSRNGLDRAEKRWAEVFIVKLGVKYVGFGVVLANRCP
jgi:hypothetical protein